MNGSFLEWCKYNEEKYLRRYYNILFNFSTTLFDIL